MKIEWLYEAQREYHDFLTYYLTMVGEKYAKRFSERESWVPCLNWKIPGTRRSKIRYLDGEARISSPVHRSICLCL